MSRRRWSVAIPAVAALLAVGVGFLLFRHPPPAPASQSSEKRTAGPVEPTASPAARVDYAALAQAPPIYDVVRPSNAPFYDHDPTLGLVNGKERRIRASKRIGDLVLFDVIYDTDVNGLRAQPGLRGKARADVLYFGSSFTFGEGVNDDQTYPWLVEQLSEGKLKGCNLGSNAWGPQHMLRYLEESREVKLLAGHAPKYLVFLANVTDVDRASGAEPLQGPHYVLDEKHQLRYQGSSQAQAPTTVSADERRRIFVEMVARAKQLFEQRYHGKFVTLLWWQNQSPAEIVDSLKARGVDSITIDEMISDYSTNPSRYQFVDYHPTPAADAAIARFLVSHLQ
jgi:hypothetical protein